MASPLDNIFGDTQEEEKDKLKNPISNSSQSRTVSADPLESIFTAEDRKPTPKQVQVESSAKQEEPKSFFDKAVSVAGKVATSVGNWFSEQSRKNAEASLPMQELMQGKTTIVKDPVTGKNKITSPRLEAYNVAKTPEEKAKILEEANQDVPLIKFLNSEAGQKVTGAIYNTTSNLPLKAIARVKSIGDDTYDEAYSALVAKSKDPENSRFENIMYGLQDSGVQSAIGALLAVGTSYLTRNPKAGQAVSLAYFAPISAESQRQDKGRVESLGNIAIDTVGDTLISGFAESALKSVIKEGGETALKEFAKQMGKGFLVEGTTEPSQTVIKYANDYRNARTDADREEVVAKFSEYVKSGAMVDEFLIGGLSGAGITAVATGAGKAIGTNVPVDPSLQSDGGSGGEKGTVKGEFNVDFSEVRDEAVSLETELRADPNNDTALRRLAIVNEQLSDYQQAVKQRPIYVADETQDNPLATIETVQYPDGRFTYSFSADTESNSIQASFVNTETYKTQKQAIEAGKKEILAWVKVRLETATGEELAKLKEIQQELKTPTKPTGVKVSLNRDAKVSQETGTILYRGGQDKGASFSTNKQIAEDFAKNRGGEVSETSLKRDAKIIDYSEVPNVQYKDITDDSVETYAIAGGEKRLQFMEGKLEKDYAKASKWAKENGYDAIRFPTEGEIRVLNDKAIQETEKDKKTSKTTEKDTTSKRDQTLTEEAKKYKTFAHFLKAQGKPYYHGTKSAEIIEKEGFKKMPIQTGVSAFGEGSYLTTSRADAKEYGGVVTAYLPSDIKLKKVSDKDAYSVDTKKLVKEGFDGTELSAGNGKNITVFDPSVIKTKTQLKAIWDNAKSADTQKPADKEQVSKNVEKTRTGVYRVTQYSAKGEAQGKVEARYTRSKKNGKLFFEVTKDGERIERLPLEKAKKKYDTTDRPTMVERAVNGVKGADGKWTLKQSNAPVIRNTTQNQVEKKPVKVKGEVKKSKAFQRVQERLGEYADIDVNYNRLNLADDTARALEFVAKFPKEAKRIALGMQGAPEGVTETAISIALAEQASEAKDFALQAQLERSRSLRQTRRGQEIVSERGRFNENSPHFFMQQVLASRIEKASKEKFKFLSKKKGERSVKTVEGKMREGTENIKRTVKKKLTATDLAQSVIDQLTC